jgi:tRNA threonylcarbamoyladenosine biosynthesis protein TsaB
MIAPLQIVTSSPDRHGDATLLALDTSSALCSVALLTQGRLVTCAVPTVRDHAQLLLPMTEAVLSEAGLALRQLDGIAFGRGPGSFTGLRVAAAVTQGLASGAELPVLPVSSLRALAEYARRSRATPQTPGWLLACMDARMGELYWGLFHSSADPVAPAPAGEYVTPPAAMLEELERGPQALSGVLAAAGMGLRAHPRLVTALKLDPMNCHETAEPRAAEIAVLAAADLARGARWLDPEAAQPVYLRDNVVRAPL